MGDSSVHEPESGKPGKGLRLTRGGWAAAAILGGLFGAAMWFAFYGWNLAPNKMDTNGYIAMALGILFTAALGGGLMALVFWSHKKGFDR